MTTFDSEKLMEKLAEERPIVVFLSNGEIMEMYLPEGETSPLYLTLTCDDDDEDACDSNDHDTFVEILESVGYIPMSPCEYTDYVDTSICDGEDCIYEED